MVYFATLSGDLNGIDRYCRFEADSEFEAQEIADNYAEENYSEHEDPYEEDETPLFGATIEIWDDAKHGEWLGDPAFNDHLDQESNVL